MHHHKTHVTPRKATGAVRPPDDLAAAILNAEFERATRPVLVAIGGPGGTGKTTFAAKLAKRLEDAAVLRLDDYKTSRAERLGKSICGPHPDANKIPLLQEHLRQLKTGRSIDKPVYDQTRGDARHLASFAPKRFVLLDGEISTYAAFREWVDFSIFIDADWKTQLATRVTRDIEKRGHSREKVLTTFLQSNLREYEEHGAESKQWADLHLFRQADHHLRLESIEESHYERHQALLARSHAPIEIAGLIVPLTTPFNDRLEIDPPAFIAHLEFLAEQGVTRLLVNGTTGEFFSLTRQERRQLLLLAREYFPGLLLLNATCDSLAATREEAQWAEDHGADGLLALPPYYFAGVGEDALLAFFQAIRAAIEVPFIPYNFPHHTQNPITARLLENLDHFAFKDSACNLNLIAATPRYFIGGDDKILAAYQKGAAGFISGPANATPAPYLAMERAQASGQDAALPALQEEINAASAPYDGVHAIAAMKTAIRARVSTYPDAVRLPMTRG